MSAMVPYTPQTLSIIPPQGGFTITLDLSTPAGRRALYNAVRSNDFTLDDLKGEVIEVEHFVVHWIVDRSPEPHDGGMRPRGVLIGPDGTRVSTGSETALRDLHMASQMCGGRGPFVPPLKFRVEHIPRKGEPGHWISLDWLLEDGQ